MPAPNRADAQRAAAVLRAVLAQVEDGTLDATGANTLLSRLRGAVIGVEVAAGLNPDRTSTGSLTP